MRARPELCLTIDVAKANANLPEILAAALSAASVSSITLRAGGENLTTQSAKPLVELAQRRSVAALIADDVELARMLKADGVHLTWSKSVISAYRAARGALGNGAIVGAEAGRSRDDAMTLGEAGADYIAFGVPAHVEDRVTAEGRQIDLMSWWSEIFEVPCVAFDVRDVDQAAALAGAGADFIAVSLPTDLETAALGAWLASFAELTASGKAA